MTRWWWLGYRAPWGPRPRTRRIQRGFPRDSPHVRVTVCSPYAVGRRGRAAGGRRSRCDMAGRQPPSGVFVGRAAELARVADVITRVRAGQPWLVSIEGDAGVGKTALARRCLVEAQDTGGTMFAGRADQFEANLDFGIVDQLLRAAGGSSPVLAPAAGNGSAISSFAMGARLLEVVGGQQPQGPLAIFIDDLQWADRKSVEALTFMLRRLSVDPVIAVVTYRTPRDRLDEAGQRMLSSLENRLHIS